MTENNIDYFNMKIAESFRKIMERNHITEKDLVRMIIEAREIAKKDLESLEL